jgi:hypothetical protein
MAQHPSSVHAQQLIDSCHAMGDRHQAEPSPTAARNLGEPITGVMPVEHRLVVWVGSHALSLGIALPLSVGIRAVSTESQMARIARIWLGLRAGALASSALISGPQRSHSSASVITLHHSVGLTGRLQPGEHATLWPAV